MRAPASASRFEKAGVVAVGRLLARLDRIHRIGFRVLEHTQQNGGVGDAPRHRPGGILVGRERDNAVTAYAPHGGLDRDQHGQIGGDEKRARRFRSNVRGPKIGGGADAGARTSYQEHRSPIEGRLARIAPRIVRVHAEAGDRIVTAWHRCRRSGDPIGELGHAGLGDDHSACRTQATYQGGFVRRHKAIERERAAGRGHTGCVNVVFQGDGNTVQRAADSSLRTFAIALVGIAQCVGTYHDHRVELSVVDGDPRQILPNQLARGDAPTLHCALHVRYAGFDEVEFAARRNSQRRQKQQHQQTLHVGTRVATERDCRAGM